MATTDAPGTPMPPSGVAGSPQATTAPQAMQLMSTPQFSMPGNPYGAAMAAPRAGY
jgi:hypothetical protein